MATFSGAVGASSDDARNINGAASKNITAQTQHLGKFNTTDDYWNGFRWTNVTIPQGATISSATVDLYSAQVTAGTTAQTIWYGVLETNTATFDTSTSYPEGKSRTSASVSKNFTNSSWNATLGYGVELVDVTTLVQEIVDQGGWASGNALAIVAHNNGSANTTYIGHSTYDRATDRGAKLEVTYTTGITLTVADISTTPTIEAPALTQANTLAVNDISTTPTIESPALTQANTLTVADVSTTPTLESPTLTQANTLAVADISATPTLEAPTLTLGAISLTVSDISTTPTLDGPALTQASTLVVNDISSAPTLETLALIMPSTDSPIVTPVAVDQEEPIAVAIEQTATAISIQQATPLTLTTEQVATPLAVQQKSSQI